MKVSNMIPNQRHLFDLPDDVAYFNCAYMGPMLKASHEAGKKALARKLRPWEISTQDFFTDVELLREQTARVINASGEDVAIVPSVSYGVGVAAANLPVRPGQHIMVLGDQFPSNVYPWMELAQKTGAGLKTLKRPADGDWTRAILEAMGSDTAVCAVANVHWTDGALVDLVKVGRRCRELGAALVVDGTQSVGVMPLDVEAVQPDFLTAGFYKWMLGPYALGFLYAAPHRQNGAPLEQSWINRKDSENFAGLVDYKDEYSPGARRYDMGEKSNFFLLPVAVAALRQILEWGLDDIAKTLGRTTNDMAARARELGYRVLPADKRGPHLIGIGFPPGAAKELAKRMAKEKVMVSVRGDAMRVAVHLYNTRDDIERLFKVLASR
jgi:selenocysteine lyase/cysteine desulfurase